MERLQQAIVRGRYPTVQRHPVKQSRWEELMSAAQQAFLMTGELVALSFAAIFAVWFADRLRRGLTGRP
jgi:hypothetical protein